MNFRTFVIFLAAAFFILYGLAFSLFPDDMLLLVAQIEPQNVSAMVDIRATYGGMTIAVGYVLIYLHYIKQTRACLVIVILVLLCMAITRIFGLILDGSGYLLMYLYLALEILGSGLAFYAMRNIESDT